MEEQAFKTIIVAHVDGDSPSWYDPNWSPEEAVVYISGRPKIVADISTLSKARAAVGNNLDAFYSVLSDFAVNSENYKDMEDDMFPRNNNQPEQEGTNFNIGNNAKFGFKRSQHFVKSAVITDPTEEKTYRVAPPPTLAVDIAIEGAKFKLQCFYHEVVISEPYLVLIFNTESVGFPKFFPEPGAVLSVTIPKLDIKDLVLVSTGIKFVHNSYEYCVLVDYASVQPQASEQEEKKEA